MVPAGDVAQLGTGVFIHHAEAGGSQAGVYA